MVNSLYKIKETRQEGIYKILFKFHKEEKAHRQTSKSKNPKKKTQYSTEQPLKSKSCKKP